MSLIQVISIIAAVCGSISRILPVTKPLWKWIPEKWHLVPPIVVIVAGTTEALYSSATTLTGIALEQAITTALVAAVTAITAIVSPGMRSRVVMFAVFVGAGACTGCAADFEESRLVGLQQQRASMLQNRDRCIELSNRRRDWGAVSLGTGILSGSTAFAALPGDSVEVKRIYLIGAGTTAALSAAAGFISEHAGDQWVREGCGQ
jgi:hypothetical protein